MSACSSNFSWFASAVAMYCRKPRMRASSADPFAVRAGIRGDTTSSATPARIAAIPMSPACVYRASRYVSPAPAATHAIPPTSHS